MVATESSSIELRSIELLYRAVLEQGCRRVCVIHASAHPLLVELSSKVALTLQQHEKPAYRQLVALGLDPSPDWPDTDIEFDTILLIPSKNRAQTHAWMARAMQMLADGGWLMFSCANRYGAKGYRQALAALAGSVSARSKAKCRLLCACKQADHFDAALADRWLAAAEVRRVETHGLQAQPGLFSWQQGDRGSLLLLAALSERLSMLRGQGMDLCCGYGLLAVELLKRYTQIDRLHLVDSDHLALDCAISNVSEWRSRIVPHWLDAATEQLPSQLDWLVCNPPFHAGQTRDVELGKSIVMQGCRSLRDGGRIYLVANRQLPYERLLQAELRQLHTLAERDGFKVLEGVR